MGDLCLSPVLRQDDTVWVVADGCGSKSDSNHEKVKAVPAIDAPKIGEPVKDTTTTVRVLGLVPTASVYVYVSEKKETWLPREPRRLPTGAEFHPTQSLFVKKSTEILRD